MLGYQIIQHSGWGDSRNITIFTPPYSNKPGHCKVGGRYLIGKKKITIKRPFCPISLRFGLDLKNSRQGFVLESLKLKTVVFIFFKIGAKKYKFFSSKF